MHLKCLKFVHRRKNWEVEIGDYILWFQRLNLNFGEPCLKFPLEIRKAGSIYLFPVLLKVCQLIPGSPQLSSHFPDLRQRRKFGKVLRQSLSELLAAFPRSPKEVRVCRSPQTRRKVLALSECEGKPLELKKNTWRYKSRRTGQVMSLFGRHKPRLLILAKRASPNHLNKSGFLCGLWTSYLYHALHSFAPSTRILPLLQRGPAH